MFRKLLVRLVIDFGGVALNRAGNRCSPTAKDGSLIPVSAPVNNLYNNGTLNNYIFNIVAPAERPEVTGVKTFLKNLERDTGIEFKRDDVPL